MWWFGMSAQDKKPEKRSGLSAVEQRLAELNEKLKQTESLVDDDDVEVTDAFHLRKPKKDDK